MITDRDVHRVTHVCVANSIGCSDSNWRDQPGKLAALHLIQRNAFRANSQVKFNRQGKLTSCTCNAVRHKYMNIYITYTYIYTYIYIYIYIYDYIYIYI